MSTILKKTIKKTPLLKRVILPVYLGTGSIIYWIFKSLNKSFSYSLIDRTKIKFWPNGQIAKGIFWGGFEKKELVTYQSLIKRGSVIIDAGANIGLYSIVGSRLTGKSGKVFSFEPSKKNFSLFLKNIELNEIKNITPINMGLGDTVGETLLLTQSSENGDAEKYILKDKNELTIVNPEPKKDHFSESILLDTLDHFQLKNNIKKVDFLKIDVEGFEYYVLKGGENLLKNNPEIIILFECAEHLAHRAGATQNAVFDFLNNLGFEIVYWDSNEEKWSNNQIEAGKSGQLIGGRNILTILNNLTMNGLQ